MELRLKIAIGLNLLVPGSGLILARREWLGFILAMAFTACGQIAVMGLLIGPEDVPQRVTACAVGLAAALWVGGQYLQWRCIGPPANSSRASQLGICHGLADDAIEQNRYQDAYGALQVALTVDDEDLQAYVKLARVAATLGKFGESRKTWKIVQQLDRRRLFRREMVQALSRLSDHD